MAPKPPKKEKEAIVVEEIDVEDSDDTDIVQDGDASDA
jgi:hypothetical protein